jgi:drug/metabolite transporter (DMT)-like permease
MGFIFFLPIIGIKVPNLLQIDFWLSAIGIGVLGTGVAYLFWNLGIQKKGAANAGLYMNFVPLAAAIFGLFFGERLENYHLISSFFILYGIYITNRKGK